VRPRLLVSSLFLVALLAPLACSSHHAAQPAPASTRPTDTVARPANPYITEIATAKVPEVQVLLNRPGDAPTTTAAPAGTGHHSAPIPRAGLNSAGVAVNAVGYEYANPTYFNNPLVFDVVKDQGDWLQVSLLARPLEQVGWVRRDDVTLSTTRYHLDLTLSDFDLKVFNGPSLVVETKVVVGTPSTPTPLGHFYVTEKIARPPSGAYGSWIMATSAYSEALDSFDGGLPQVAFHGTNKPALVGTQSSNGCVRMPDPIDIQLAGMLPAGTPITIQA
jgi:hypothetical protein